MNHPLRKSIWLLALILLSFPARGLGESLFIGKTGSTTTLSNSQYAQTVAIKLGDVDNDGILTEFERVPTDGVLQLFYLKHFPMHRLIKVEVNGSSIPSKNPALLVSNFAYHREAAWISFRIAYSTADVVQVTYNWSNDLDIVAGNGETTGTGQPNVVYKNQTSYGFTKEEIGDSKKTQAVGLGDVNGDGFLDVAVANYRENVLDPIGKPQLYINDGTGAFPTISDLYNPLVYGHGQRILMVDYDNDMDLDIAVADSRQPNNLYRNEGGNRFSLQWYSEPNLNTHGMDFGDYDNDGDLDLILGSHNWVHPILGPIENRIQIYKNEISTGPFLLALNHNVSRFLRYDLNDEEFVDGFGEVGSGPDQVNSPWGVAVDEEFIYVSDSGNHRIVKKRLDDFSFVAEIGTYGTGNDQFKTPAGIAVDDTHLFICDIGNGRVVRRFKADLSYDAQFGVYAYPQTLPDEFRSPWAIAVQGNYIYYTLAAMVPGNMDGIQKRNKFTLSSGATDFISVRGYGSGDDQFKWPTGIAVDDNFVYVADTFNDRIHKRNIADLTLDSQAPISSPYGMKVFGNNLYASSIGGIKILDRGNLSVIKTMTGGMWGPYWSGEAFGLDIILNPNEYQAQAFKGPVWTSAQAMATKDVRWADVDNDGNLDVVVLNDNDLDDDGMYEAGKSHVVYKNTGVDGNGNPLLTEIWEAPNPASAESVAIRDLNSDGYLDLIIAEDMEVPHLRYYINDGDGTFTYKWGSDEAPDSYDNFQGSQVAVADMNNDTQLDIVASAEAMAIPSGEFMGHVIFGPKPFVKVIKMTAEVGEKNEKVKIVNYYKVNPNGSMGPLISSEVK